ncbi:DNA polymerase nu-like isoform X2 [Asterias amurensis]|uniref:DNA polymerase nu-like isoform X2 n=1 Tax=Asterias amurensis TaxID=7602 RepID=UPI003AB12311
MSPVWTPLKPPPEPDDIHMMSDDAWTILHALREAHRKREGEARQQRLVPLDPKTYYKTLYQESFKAENPSQDAIKAESSETSVPCRAEMVEGSTEIKSEDISSQNPPLFSVGIEQASIPSSTRRGTHQIGFTTSGGYRKDPDWHRLDGGQHNQLESSRVHRSDFERVTSSGESARYTASSTCSKPPQLRSDPHDAPLIGSVPVSSQLPNIPRDPHRLDCSHHKDLVLNQESSKIHRSDIEREARIGESARYTASSTCSKPPQLRSDPHDAPLIGSVPVSSQLPNSPPIDTNYYLEFQQTVEESSRDLTRYPEHIEGSSDLSLMKTSGNSGSVRNLLDKDIVHPARRARNTDGDGELAFYQDAVSVGKQHPRVGRCGEVLASKLPVAGLETRITSGNIQTSDQTGLRQVDLKRKAFDSSTSHQQDVPLKVKKSLELQGLRSNINKSGQPTLDKLFGGSTSSITSTTMCNKEDGMIQSVAGMTVRSRVEVCERLTEVDEVYMCLVYRDGSSQLREPQSSSNKKHCIGPSDDTAECLVIAYTKQGETGVRKTMSQLEGISLPLKNADIEVHQWSRKTLLNVMSNESIQKVCFDAQEMIHAVLVSFNLDPVTASKWLVFDPKVAAWLLDADHPPVTFTDLLTTYLPDYKKCSATYKDLAVLGSVMKHLFPLLKEANLWQLFQDLEMRLCPILAAMEVQGISVHSKTLVKYAEILQSKILQVEQETYKAAGHPFQIASHTQLRHILFEELHLDKLCQGKKLARTNVLNLKSTSETVLNKLQSLHPLPKLVLRYRQLVKLKSTYVDGLLESVDHGCIHTSWEQTAAASGRLQSANPNLQNIPKQSVVVEGTVNDNEQHGCVSILARKPFVSHTGWSFIAADFQSIELRLLAHLSNDPVLLRAFNKKDCQDIFAELTSQWLGMPSTEVTTLQREKTKRIVYSVIYGVGPDKLAETLSVSREEAKTFTKSFLSTFRGVSSFTRSCISCCQRHGFVQTILKRRRLIPNINSCNFHVRSHAERQCVNFVVQGSAADVCKVAMIQVVHALAARPTLKARLLVQIHDELLLEVADEDVEQVKGILKAKMEVKEFHFGSGVHLQVPLPVSISTGTNWGQLE